MKCPICYSNNAPRSTCPLIIGAKLNNCFHHYNAELVQLTEKANFTCVKTIHQNEIPISGYADKKMKCYDFRDLSVLGRMSEEVINMEQELETKDQHTPEFSSIKKKIDYTHQQLHLAKTQIYKDIVDRNIVFTEKRNEFIKSNILCGIGSFKNVFLGYDLSDSESVAWVQLSVYSKKKRKEIFKKIQNEINILANIKHENIVDIKDHWKDETGSIVFILEYVGLTLQDVKEIMELRRIDPVFHAEFLYEDVVPYVLRALLALNQEEIIHRDIKPDNIGISNDGSIKLIDFSEATLYSTEYPRRLMSIDETEEINPKGTLWYMPPEAFASVYDNTSDVYSFGLTLLELLTLVRSFGPNTDEECMIQKFRLFNQYDKLDKNQVLKKEYANFINFDNKSVEYQTSDKEQIDNIYKIFGKYGSFFKRFISDCIGKPDTRLTPEKLLKKYYNES